ncbi:molybdopterin converting factor subunit 1 [Aestuariibacter halophilus]|uniref:Molybdopterin synthase sulfur carrier subunit n=1 Tax=Fluctibacter halophilus TaxID=226011 RepID=A0ABS8G4Y0_9ALTE|nr:molybdopterin converting factor subunit 1 [Aestuariibacter halophilus]MCC2615548.1 molybdopterin converting factor subunit 1 [Aestuariibacter halophilus]
MIKVLFFAQLKDVLGTGQLEIDEPINDVAALRRTLQARGELWSEYLSAQRALVAVNQTIAHEDTRIGPNDEVAFFPPVTGG